jgi:hypothetical protein
MQNGQILLHQSNTLCGGYINYYLSTCYTFLGDFKTVVPAGKA